MLNTHKCTNNTNKTAGYLKLNYILFLDVDIAFIDDDSAHEKPQDVAMNLIEPIFIPHDKIPILFIFNVKNAETFYDHRIVR